MKISVSNELNIFNFSILIKIFISQISLWFIFLRKMTKNLYKLV